MALTHLADARTEGDPDPAEVITVTLGGKTFRCGRRTAAHIEWTIDRLARIHPSANLRILQGCYNSTVPASKGTHDGDGVIDFFIDGLTGGETQDFLRMCGWADWHRFPPMFPEHNHAVSIGCPGPVGIYVPAQVEDYRAYRSGLAGHVADHTFHPADIDATVFDYPAWLQEDDMTPDQVKKLDGIATAVASLADMVEALAEGDEAIKRRITKAKREITAAVKADQ